MRWAVVALVLALPAGASGAEPKLSAKVEKTAPPDALAEPVRKTLDEDALVVNTGDA